MEWGYVIRHLPDFTGPLLVTLRIFALSVALAATGGALVALARMSHQVIIRSAAAAYIELYRNTPLLIQLFFIFFGLPLIGISFPRITAGILAIAMQHAAFFAEIYRGAIRAIPEGQYQAGTALGMTRMSLMRRVVLPQCLRDSIPAGGNQVILILLDTSLVATIGVMDITLRALTFAERTALSLEMFVIVAIFYLAASSLASAGLRVLEVRYAVRR